MKTLSATLLSLMITATRTLAAGGGSEGEGLGLTAMFFIGFGVLIILFQFVPAVMLLVGILKGIFSPAPKKARLISGNPR